MLARHILGYLPSLVIPALVAFGAIFCYTRLLSPAEFGYYALTLNAMTLIAAAFYYWMQTSLLRLMPSAVREGNALGLQTTAYYAFVAVSFLLIILTLAYASIASASIYRSVIIIAVPLSIFRALLSLNQAIHRSQMRIGRYNAIECGQAVLGLAAGLMLVMGLHTGSYGAVIGMMIGMAAMALVDARTLISLCPYNYQPAALKQILAFGLPMIATSSLSTFLSVSDRFLVEHFRGAADLGMYAAGYTVMDRIIGILFMMVATPSFPITIHKLEHEGTAAAQAQTFQNGVAVLAIAVPACAGLILTSSQIAGLLIGPEFRAGALQVMPWIAVSAILGGLAIHYFDHAFYLAKRPGMLLFTQGPAALFNLCLNLILIPRYGYMGAAYANVAAYAALLLLSITVGRRVFAISFPLIPALQISFATLLMCIVLYVIPFPTSFLGLGSMVAIGGITYISAILAMDMQDARVKLAGMFCAARRG